MQVVRCFENDDIIHVENKVDPVADVETINLELGLADLGQIEKRMERVTKTGRSTGADKAKAELEKGVRFVVRLRKHTPAGQRLD